MIKLITNGLAAALLFSAGWQARGVVAERDEARAAAAAERGARAAYAAEAAANTLALENRETEMKRLAAERADARGKLNEVFTNDSKIWADTDLPEPVERLFR